MPWSIKKRGSQYCVVKDDDGEVEGCHSSREKAVRQQRALYASERMSIADFNKLADRLAAALEHEFVSKLQAVYEREFNAIASAVSGKFALVAAGEWTPPSESELIARVNLEEANQLRVEAMERYVASLSAALPVRDWTVSGLFSQELDDFLATRAGAAFDVEMRETLREIIRSGFERGLSVRGTSNEIREAFEGLAGYRADMLARTDLNSISNAGSLRAAAVVYAGDPIYKTWLSARDNRVRIEHAHADGQTVPLEHPFTVGGFHAMFPGDPSLPLRLSANCRCTQIYVEGLTAGGDILGGTMSEDGATEDSVLHLNLDEIEKWNPILSEDGKLVGWAADTEEAVEDEVEAPSLVPWKGVLAIEGIPTEDTGIKRFLMRESLSWRDLPLSLMLQTVNEEGHKGAEVCGRIDQIWKVPATDFDNTDFAIQQELPPDAVLILGSGVFDDGDAGTAAARLIENQMLRGMSVDLVDAHWVILEASSLTEVEQDEIDFEQPENYFRGAKTATIGAVTIVPIPAIGSTHVSLAADGSGLDPRLQLALDRLSLVTQRERFEGYKLGMDLGILTLNDVLAAEGKEPIEGGDKRFAHREPTEPPVEKQETVKVVVGGEDKITETVVQTLDLITERLAAGEKLNESMIASLRTLAEMETVPPVIKVEPQITVPVPEVNVTVDRGAQNVTFQRDSLGRIISAEVDEADGSVE